MVKVYPFVKRTTEGILANVIVVHQKTQSWEFPIPNGEKFLDPQQEACMLIMPTLELLFKSTEHVIFHLLDPLKVTITSDYFNNIHLDEMDAPMRQAYLEEYNAEVN